MSGAFLIADRQIGNDAPCFVIAEAGVNHNGKLEKALALVDAAARSGADAVKFQTFSATRLASATAPKARYQIASTSEYETQREMLARLELDEAAHRSLMERAAKRNILFLSSPFDEQSADLLEQLGVVAFKVPSGELTNHALLAHVARKGRPLIVSTGMADLAEVCDAVSVIRRAAPVKFALLHCVSVYPADASDANLRAMATMSAACDVPIGWSDHMQGIDIALAAVALGATVVEKHITLDRTLPGPDHAASLEPDEFRSMVRSIRLVSAARGDGTKRQTVAEAEIAAVARKSLVAARDLTAGHTIAADDLQARRPGTGLSPSLLPELIGRELRVALRDGEMLRRDALR
jgi:N,N'-diacetyllegionaminate synthase